jgi:hypothetical protein
MNDIEVKLIPTDELIGELERRYPDGSIIAYEVSSDQAKDDWVLSAWHRDRGTTQRPGYYNG